MLVFCVTSCLVCMTSACLDIHSYIRMYAHKDIATYLHVYFSPIGCSGYNYGDTQ